MSYQASHNPKEHFLRNLYQRGPFAGHALICHPTPWRIWQLPGGDYSASDRPLTDCLPIILDYYHREVQYHQQVDDDGIAVAQLRTGSGIFASCFGAPIHHFADSNPCALPFVKTAQEADALPDLDLYNCRPLMRVFDLARLLRRELGQDAPIGICDCQSGFDTACLIWDKAELFMAMYGTDEERAAVHRLAAKCTRLLKQFLREYTREFAPVSPCICPFIYTPPGLGPWVSNDECGAFGTEAFEEFCLPELLDLATTFGGLGMHCCAHAQHQFPAFARIPNFYAFNRVPGQEGIQALFPHLAGPQGPVITLAWLDTVTLQRAAQTAPPGTRFAFVAADLPPDQARQWLQTMAPYRFTSP